MQKDLSVIFEEQIAKINLILTVKDIQGGRIYLCETLHLTLKKLISDSSGNLYMITDFLLNEWIDVMPYAGAPAVFVSETVKCPEICFFSGAPASINNEYLDKEADTRDKTPLIWLLENYEEDFFGRESSVERKSRFRLFLLDETDEVEWTSKQHHTNVIQPLMNLCDKLVEVFQDDRTFKTIEIFTKIPRVRFGKYVDSHGNERKIIDEDFSGIELAASFEKFKTYKCNILNNC